MDLLLCAGRRTSSAWPCCTVEMLVYEGAHVCTCMGERMHACTSAWGRTWVATQAPKRGLPEAPPAAVWTQQQVPNALCVSCAVQIKAAPAFVQTVRHCSQCCLVAYATHPRVAHAGKRRKFNERDHAGAVLQVLQAGRGNTRSPRFRDAPRISTWPQTPMQRPSSRDPPCCDPHRAG